MSYFVKFIYLVTDCFQVDMLKSKKQLLDIIKILTNGIIAGNPIPKGEKNHNKTLGYGYFSDVFLVSALNGDGVRDIKVKNLKIYSN